MNGRITAPVAAIIDGACSAAGVHPAILQGSYNTGVGASAGTHAGGGAFDLDARHITTAAALRLVDELRRRGVAAWLRTPQYGYHSPPPHIHGIVIDTPDLSPAARAQVADYRAGRNGLADHGPDPHPRPTTTTPPTREWDVMASKVEIQQALIEVMRAPEFQVNTINLIRDRLYQDIPTDDDVRRIVGEVLLEVLRAPEFSVNTINLIRDKVMTL